MTLQSIYGNIFTKVITPLVWNIHRMLSVSIISWCFRCTLFALQLMHYWRIKQCIFHLRELIYLLLFIINITHIHWGEKKHFSFLRFRGACWLTVLFCLYTMSWNPAFFPPSSKRRSVFFTSVYFFLLASENEKPAEESNLHSPHQHLSTKWSNPILLEYWYIFKGFFVTSGLLSTSWYQQNVKLSSSTTMLQLSCCNPFSHPHQPRLTHLHCNSALDPCHRARLRVARQKESPPAIAEQHNQEGKRHRIKYPTTDIMALRQHWCLILSLAVVLLQYCHGITTSPLKYVRKTYSSC